ncbi:hypothetical protein F4808DRAFT_457576 [Astrocystis sublimbata]|nr:hypothetical protein F4808DRAFT_457576 [Astrocystis sublimbata]
MATQPAIATIELTPTEAQLKGLLLDVAHYVDSQSTSEPVILRWAGGWVRDKLLGIESHDIDTAINNMTGEAFALKIQELCAQPSTSEKHSISPDDIGSLHKIAKNPDKSKHLETTTIKLFGLDLDFVNLRKETYMEDSRNPQMEFGTAEEDALRRDATVNALFYNLNTGQVEDFTTGLVDLESKLIRTPLEPLQTFMDDPLRVLRLVRFASRLGFAIDPAAEEVMGDVRVLDALKLKISRERVGTELEKMLKGKDPRKSLEYIEHLGLYHTIFTDPTRPNMPVPDLSRWRNAYECLNYIMKNQLLTSLFDVSAQTKEPSYYAWTLSALVPWTQLDELVQNGKDKRPLPYITLAVREGLRPTNKLCDLVTAAHRNRTEVLSLKTAVVKKAAHIHERDTFGMAIRHWDAKGGHWRLQVLFSLLVESMQRWDLEDTKSANNSDFLGEWQSFIDHLHVLDVMDAASLERIVNGTELAKALGVKPGRWMAGALEVCAAWQFRHPHVTDPAGAIEEVASRRKELQIPSSS